MVPHIIKLRNFFAENKYPYLAGVCILFVTNTMALGIPWVIKLAVDHIQGLGTRSELSFLNECAVWILLLAGIYAVFRVFSRLIIFGAGRKIEAEIRGDIYHHAQFLDNAFFDHNPTGKMVSLLTNDTNVVRLLFGMGFLNLVNGVLIYVLAACLMFYLNPKLAFWALVPYLLIFLIIKNVSPKFHFYSRKVQEEIATMTHFVNENLIGHEIVRNFSNQEAQSSRFSKINQLYLDLSMKLTKVRGLLFTSTGAIGGLGNLLILWVGGKQVIQGVIGLGDFVAFFGYVNLLVMPTLMFGFVISIWNRGKASVERIEDFLNTKPLVQFGSQDVNLEQCSVSIRNLDFSYPIWKQGQDKDLDTEAMKKNKVLRDITLDIPAGKVTAIVGPVGSGKSSLVALMSKLYPVEDSKVKLGQYDINMFNKSSLRSLSAVAPQDLILFSMSLGENIRFGMMDGSVNENRVQEAFQWARIGQASGEHQLTLETMVGERGTLLSGGQKQRVGLARVFARKAPILIFDEPFSSLDNETCQHIMNSLKNELAGHTVILVTHKVGLIRDVDHIVVMNDGKISDIGRHEDLIVHSKTYQNLFAIEEMNQS